MARMKGRMKRRRSSSSSSSSSSWVSSGSPKLKKAFAEIMKWMSDSSDSGGSRRSALVPYSGMSRVRRHSAPSRHVSFRTIKSSPSTQSTWPLGSTQSTWPLSRRNSESMVAPFISRWMRYGNYCGPDWSAGEEQPSVISDVAAVDTVDAACKKHDAAYAKGGDLAKADVIFTVNQLANIGRSDSAYGSIYAGASAVALAGQAAVRYITGRTHGGGPKLYEKPHVPGIMNHEQVVLDTGKLRRKYKRKGLMFTIVK